MTPAVTGRLRPSADAPPKGEWSEEIAQLGGVVVEHILSGALRSPVDYDQDHDEWVVLLNGEATLEVGGETVLPVAGSSTTCVRKAKLLQITAPVARFSSTTRTGITAGGVPRRTA
jgi:hypothetical protein